MNESDVDYEHQDIRDAVQQALSVEVVKQFVDEALELLRAESVETTHEETDKPEEESSSEPEPESESSHDVVDQAAEIPDEPLPEQEVSGDEAAREELAGLFERMSSGRPELAKALEAYFLDNENPPSPEQQELLQASLRLLRKIADELRASVTRRTPKGRVAALRIFEKYVGKSGVTSRSRAELVARFGGEVYNGALGDIALAFIFDRIGPDETI